MPQHYPKAALAIGTLALAVSQSFAQSASSPTPAPTLSAGSSPAQWTTLDPVVVTASRFEDVLSEVPALAQVISREDIQESGAHSVSDVLQKLANLNVRSPLGGQLGIQTDVDMRGFGASARDNTLILVDGMRVSPIDSGSIRWESIPLRSVDRIEVIHGGGSVQYGDKAVGGVVNIITREESLPEASASLRAGSFGTVLSNAALRSQWGRTQATIDINADRTDGWRENSQAWQRSARAGLFNRLDHGGKVFAEVSYFDQKYYTPGGVVGEVNQGDRRAAKFNNIDERTQGDGSRGVIGVDVPFGGDLRFSMELAYSESTSRQTRPYYGTDSRANSAGLITYHRYALDVTPRLRKTWDARHDSVFGLDYQRASANYKPDIGDQKRDNQDAVVINQAAYILHRYLISDSVQLDAGLRRQMQKASARERYTLYDWDGNTVLSIDSVERDKTQVANAGDVAVTYKFGDGYQDRLFLRSNRSYRFANTDEFWGCETDPVTGYCGRQFKGILKPQRAQTYEIGAILAFGQSTVFRASVYRLDTSNEIRYDLGADGGNGANVNADDIRRRGASMEMRHSASPRLSLHAAMTWQETKYLEGIYVGKEVPLVPKVMSVAGIMFRATPALHFGLNVNYTGNQRYMDDDDNSKKRMPSYLLSDLITRYQTGRWEFDFQVKNLTDTKYASYGGYGFITKLPTSGFSYYYYPGDPRTFWLAARYRFQ